MIHKGAKYLFTVVLFVLLFSLVAFTVFSFIFAQRFNFYLGNFYSDYFKLVIVSLIVLFFISLLLYDKNYRKLKHRVVHWRFFNIINKSAQLIFPISLLLIIWNEISAIDSVPFLQNFIYLIFSISCAFMVWIHSDKLEKAVASDTEKKKTMYCHLLFMALFVIGTFLRLWHLSEDSLYHDELKQYQVLQGLLNKGEIGVYNQFTESIDAPYQRAHILVYLSAFIVKMFGNSELVIRLPVALAGVMLIFAFYMIFKKLFNRNTALIGILILIFNPYLIYISRFYRDYAFSILFFIITFYFFSKLLIKINKFKNYKDIRSPLIGSVIFFLLTYHFGHLQALVLLFVFLMFFLVIFFKNKIAEKKYFKKYIFLALGGILLFFLVDYFDVLRIINIKNILKNHVSLDLLKSNYSGIYFRYLFSSHFKQLIPILLLISFIFAFAKKRLLPVFLILLTAFGYYAVAFVGERYEDFRYITFLMPVAIGALAYGINFLFKISQVSFSGWVRKPLYVVVFIILLLIPVYQTPFHVAPGSIFQGHVAKAQVFWEKNEGADYIHRRTVAPEYKKVFSFINNEIKKGDVIIFHGGENIYLTNFDGVEVYLIARKTDELQNAYTMEIETTFWDLLQEKEKNIWFVGTYVHLMDKRVINYLLSDKFQNIGKDLGVKEFLYNEWYAKKNTTWPTAVYRKGVLSE